ncbi:MAG: DEAD/DEAH box helicase [Gemmataceae bacterium]|nr:DEAD/DEAH box helicase [Gemmataceae bacterium]
MAPTRDQLAEQYLAQLPYPPYPMQEEALLAWFTADQGVLVCAPTGTGKTVIAQAALFEALHTDAVAYYTTPLIALTEQKFREMQECAVRWGFDPNDVGLVTGNRRVNPEARILVVVAEILLNRLLHPEQFDFHRVAAVVMDEFHSFNDPERGIVWELSLALLPPQARLLLLSATVGNAREFLSWLERCHGRKLELVESKQRKVPLSYHWVPDQFLTEQLVEMAKGDAGRRTLPALVFCFNRDECWSIAEQLKGLPLLTGEQKSALHAEVNRLDWTQGVGPKMKQLLHRGVGVHHAGLLPKYRRVVEELFTRKLLAVVLCTETLAAGINLPARSVVLSTLVKGPTGKQRLIDASTAQQIFGRAGRPQFDDQGYVFALAHEDDVKILRWKEKYDQIPETTRDPVLLKVKKELKRKKPTRRENQVYWSEGQFKQLQTAPPAKLYSKGPIPWRLLAYLLKISPEVQRVRAVLRKRLMDEPRIQAAERHLESMLQTLARAGYVTLAPPPPVPGSSRAAEAADSAADAASRYQCVTATPTPALDRLLVFRSIHPLYGAFLLQHLGIADREERLQALESVLELPRSVLRYVRVPREDSLPPGPLARNRLDEELIRRGLMVVKPPPTADDDDLDDDAYDPWEEEAHPPVLAEKLRLLFDAQFPEVTDLTTQAVWAAGELFRYGGDFNKYVQGRDLVKQEGIIFRHLLRLILLCGEFAQVTPAEADPAAWQQEMRDLAERLTASCRAVDPESTDEAIEKAHAADVVEGESR